MNRILFSLLSAIFLWLPLPIFAQDGVPNDPTTAMTIESGDPIDSSGEDPNNQDVPADSSYAPPQEPFAPDLPDTVGNYEGPVGVTGIFNGNVTTGCSYDPLSHSAHRAIDDIVVPGSIGKYPLKMTRYYNTRQQYYALTAIGLGPGWAHEYSWLLWTAGHKVVSPHGSVYDDYCGAPVGVSERWENRTDAYNGTWRLADGGKVVFSGGHVTDIYDPYGQRTRIAYDANGQRVKVTEPGGRCLWFTYSDQDQDGTSLLTWVEAFDVDGSPGSPTHPTGNRTDWVNYTYTACDPGVQGRPWKKMLTGVNYSDGTSASYQYRTDNVPESSTSHKMYPLLQRCDDVRYNGPMHTIWYEYEGGGPHGAIIDEKYPGVGPVSAIGGSIDTFTEARGDGPTRSFTYTHINHCIGTDCTPCDDVQNNNPPQQMLTDYTDFQGHTTHLGYDANWYINSVRDANTHTTSYLRGPPPPNGIGQITQITHPGDNTYIGYTYESDPHYIHSIRDERGGVTTYTRDANYRVTRIDYPSNQYTPASYETFTYNDFGQVLIHRLKNGAYESFAYDTRGLLTDKWNPKQNAVPGGSDPHTHYTHHTWWGWADRIQTETLPANVSNQVASKTYEYDRNASGGGCPGRGLVTKITHADGTFQSVSYSQLGNKMWEENELRQRTSYAYDNYNRVLSITEPGIGAETFSYLKPGTNSSYLHTTNSVYTHTSRTGIVTTNIYDQNFRKTSTTVGSSTTWFHYDPVGNQDYVTDPRGSGSGDSVYSIYTDYDARNRKWRVREPLSHVTEFHYDDGINLTRVIRPDQTTESKTYDAVNRVLTDTVPQTNTVNLTTTYSYNPSGTIASVTDAKAQVTRFTYDASDQKIQMTYPNSTDLQSWSYDDAHNLASRTTVNGETQYFAYDNRNRLVRQTWSNSAEWRYFNYDAANRLIEATNGSGSWWTNIISDVTRAYDAAGRLYWERQNITGLGVFDVRYEFNADGHETRLYVMNTGYDYTFSYDAMGRFEKIFNTGSTNPYFQYYYDAASNETQRYNLSNGVTQIYTRDALNRMSRRDIKKGATTYSYEVYGYDAMSRLSSVAREDGTTDSFTYYLDGELNTAQYGATVRTVGYYLDKAGNRNSVTDTVYGNTSYTPNNFNQYTAVTGSTISNGPEHEISAYQNVTYTYINDEHLTRASDGTNTYDLKYDALGRCVKRTLNGNDTYYIYDGEKPILEYNAGGGLVGWNLYGKGIDEIIERGAYGQPLPQPLPANWQLVAVADFNGDGHPDYVLYNTSTFQTAIWYLNNNVFVGSAYGPTLPANWQLVAVADFNGDGHPDYALYNTSTFQTAIWYLNNNVLISGTYGPTLPANWQLVAVADFNGDGHPDYALYNTSTFQTAIWYLNNNVFVSGAYGPTLPANWQLVAVADFNGDGHPDYALYNTSTFQTAIWYLNNNVLISGTYGPTLPANWQLVAVADFNGDGHPDYVLYNTSTFQTAIWYLNNNVLVGSAYGANAWDWYFLQQDHEGSVTHLTDASGNVIEKYRYDAFGAPTIYAPDGTVRAATAYNNRFLFTGREYAATYQGTYVSTFSFYEYRARAYNPTLGRFMSEDPKLFDAGDYNLFRYCHNDPIDFTDPMGLETGFGESLIPVWGEGHLAYDAYSEGRYGMAALHTVLAVTDVSGVKAGVGALVKTGIKVTGKVAERSAIKAAERRAATLAENRAAGKAFEKTTENSLKAAHPTVEKQVTLKTESGTRTRVDFVTRDPAGNVGLTEAKSSATAPLTSNQAKAFPEIQQSGASVVGAGKPEVPGGTQIPPTKVEILRPPDLPPVESR